MVDQTPRLQLTCSQFCLAPRRPFSSNHSFVADPRSKRSRQIVCALTDKGRNVKAADIDVKSPVGEGSYGQVFQVEILVNQHNLNPSSML